MIVTRTEHIDGLEMEKDKKKKRSNTMIISFEIEYYERVVQLMMAAKWRDFLPS